MEQTKKTDIQDDIGGPDGSLAVPLEDIVRTGDYTTGQCQFVQLLRATWHAEATRTARQHVPHHFEALGILTSTFG